MEPPTEKPLRDFTKYVVPSVENVREDVIDTWRRLAIPALTFHLTEVDVKEQETGFHKALVMVPVCPSLLEKWSDPNELIDLITK